MENENSTEAMSRRRFKIRVLPDPVLRTFCTDIEIFDDQLKIFARRMIAHMTKARGIGLAGPQIGVSRRVITIAVYDPVLFLVNPSITPVSTDAAIDEEGCLSIPGRTYAVPRLHRIEVRAFNLSGKKMHFTADDFFARVIQHECDHLDGILICDRGREIDRMDCFVGDD